jgi:hypothetical protein
VPSGAGGLYYAAYDGRVGIVFLNISKQPQHFTFRLRGDQYGFPPGVDLLAAASGLDQAKQPTREVYGTLRGGKGRIEHTLQARGIWALEVSLATR